MNAVVEFVGSELLSKTMCNLQVRNMDGTGRKLAIVIRLHALNIESSSVGFSGNLRTAS